MIELDENFILIPKGAGNFYEIHQNELIIESSWGGNMIYRVIKQISTKAFFNEEVYRKLRDFIISYAELEGVILDEFVLNNSLQPVQQDNDQLGVVSDIFYLEDVF